MGEFSLFEKKMEMLGRPYKKSSAYEVYGDTHQERPERSVFWETSIRYLERYQHCDFQTK